MTNQFDSIGKLWLEKRGGELFQDKCLNYVQDTVIPKIKEGWEFCDFVQVNKDDITQHVLSSTEFDVFKRVLRKFDLKIEDEFYRGYKISPMLLNEED